MALSQDQFERVVRDMPGFGRDPASIRRRIEAMEAMLEGLLVIPGTNRRVGLDSLVGLVPVAVEVPSLAALALVAAACTGLVAYEAIRFREARARVRQARLAA